MLKLASYFPERLLSNDLLTNQSGEISPSQIFRLFGVVSRHRCEIGQTGFDMALGAADKLKKKVSFEGIDFMVYSTLGLDYVSPTSSSQLHKALQLAPHVGTIDMPSGCTGFIYGLSVIKGLLSSGVANKLLFLLGEVPSTSIAKDDLELQAIFGDAGAALLIDKESVSKIGNFIFGTDGNGFSALHVERGGVKHPIDNIWLQKHKNEENQLNRGQLKMDGLEVFRFALEKVPTLMKETLEKNQLDMNDINLVIFHQAGKQILNALKRKCKIPDEKFFVYYEQIGNTVSCSIPITIEQAVIQNKIKPGDKILIIAFGVGFTWGGTVLEW
jgi:3-oxoacyl-[acyl-carrier-protein] synthase III